MRVIRLGLSIGVSFALCFEATSYAQVASINRESITPSTTDGDADSGNLTTPSVAISDDGSVVAFSSNATNIEAGDSNGASDVFVRFRSTSETVRVSRPTSGGESDGASAAFSSTSNNLALSGDGNYVTFVSDATNLSLRDINSVSDVFHYNIAQDTMGVVSTNSNGQRGNRNSYGPSISRDGTLVAFVSLSDNWITADQNAASDIFLKDTLKGTLTLISVSSGSSTSGPSANGASETPAISADGNFISFASLATNLVANDTNAASDIFLRDLNKSSGSQTRISVDSSGNQANGGSFFSAISEEGKYVAFVSDATNLVSDDTNGVRDVFVRDTQSNTTVRVSVSSAGVQGNKDSGSDFVAISGNGRYVVYKSQATNLVPKPGNAADAIYIFDRQTSLTARLSQSLAGSAPNGLSGTAAIDNLGDVIVFDSSATNLVNNDLNSKNDVFSCTPGAFPEVFSPTTVLQNPPTIAQSPTTPGTITVVMEKFFIKKKNTPHSLAFQDDEAFTRALKPLEFNYTATVKPTDPGRSDVYRKTGKKNSLTFINLPSGNYSAKYRVRQVRGTRVIRSTKPSPVATFKIN